MERLIILLGIIPPHSAITGNNGGIFQRFYKVYVSFLIFIITLTIAIAINFYIIIVQSGIFSITLIFTDCMQYAANSICIFIAILAPSVLYSSSLDAMLDNYEHMCNTSFMEEIFKITSSKKFIIQATVSHVILIILCIYDSYVNIIIFEGTEYTTEMFRIFQIYHNFMTILTIYVYVKFIRTCLERANHYLSEKLEARGIRGKKTNLAIEEKLAKFDNDKICSAIRQITQYYEQHVQQIALFNKVFGCQLLCLVLSFVIGLIHSINVIIIFCVSNTHQEDSRAQIVLAHLLWTLWQLIIGGLAVVMCTETEKAGKTTGDICINALTNLPYSSENEKLKEELFLLNCLVNQKNPSFSAAGFFYINYSLLLGIIGSITSYVIVLIQFNKI